MVDRMTEADMDLAIPTVLKKDSSRAILSPNLSDYDKTWRDFSWDDAQGELDGLPRGGGLNIAFEAVDRHATGANAGKLALRRLTLSTIQR